MPEEGCGRATGGEDGEGGSGLRDKLSGWWNDLLKLLVVGLPTLLIQQSYKWVADRFFDQPWEALWFLMPLAGAGWLAWRIVVRREGELVLRGPMLVFFAFYVTVFAVAAQSDVLDWRRELVGPGDAPPSSWLLPTRFGDWRYWVARAEAGPADLLVVTTEQPESVAAGRQEILRLISLAGRHAARGIAFDFHIQAETTRLDPLLCREARRAGIPVVFGYRMEEGATGRWRPRPLAPALQECREETYRGHLMVLRDVDRRVRLVPLRFGQGERPPLSLRLAALLEDVPLEELRHPGRFLQPLPSPAGHPIAAYQELVGAGDAAMGAELRGMFLLVGEASDDERFDTPTGDRLGVEIHADAVQALRTGSYLRRVPPALTLGVILVLCYLVAALAAAGAPAGKLVKVALGGSTVLVAGSALATWAARLWVDVVYGLVAAWLLLVLLLALRRLPGFAGVSRDGARRGGASP